MLAKQKLVVYLKMSVRGYKVSVKKAGLFISPLLFPSSMGHLYTFLLNKKAGQHYTTRL